MVSEVRISNLALTALGAKTITARSDNTTEARLVDIHYDEARDATLEAREWTFAVHRQTLAKSAETPDWGFSFYHQIPSDTLRILEARQETPERVNFRELSNRLDWRREGDRIASDSGTVRVRYLRRITDPNKYTAAFVHCLSARLAYEMSIPITQSRSIQADMFSLYEAKLVMAAQTDGMQGRTEIIRSSRLTGIRGVGASVNAFADGTV